VAESPSANKKTENPKISWLTVIFLGGLAPFSVKIHWKFTLYSFVP
jgi:hypothetical protein